MTLASDRAFFLRLMHPQVPDRTAWHSTISRVKDARILPLLPLCSLILMTGCGAPHGAPRPNPPPLTLEGHNDRVSSLCFSPDGTHLVSASADGTIRIWETTKWTGKLVNRDNEQIPGALTTAYSPDGSLIAAGRKDGVIKLYRASGKEMTTYHTDGGGVRCLAFSPRERLLAAGNEDGTVSLRNLQTDELVRTLSAHKGAVWCVRFTADGNSIATGGCDQTVRLWETATGAKLRTLDGLTGLIRSIAYSPDDRVLAVGGSFLWLYDATTGRKDAVLTGHASDVTSVSFAADGKTLVSGCLAGDVKIWDIASRRVKATLWGSPREEVWAVAWSPNEETLVSGTARGKVVIWDLNRYVQRVPP